MLQPTPQGTPWRRFDKIGHGYAERRIPTGRARKSRNKISFAYNAIMSEQYVILYYIVGPTVGDPTAMYAPPLGYKREALAAHRHDLTDSQTLSGRSTRHAKTLNFLRAQAMQHIVDVRYYAPAARTTLNLLCSSRSTIEIGLILANP